MEKEKNIVKPTFFIVGTMKGGTTILYDFICSHESVTKAKEKEIHYFSLYPQKGIDWYLSHFEAPSENITGEASPSYFDVAYTNAIPSWINAFNSAAKIILIIRDPVERAVSHFFHLKNINKVPLFQDMDINSFFSSSFDESLKQTSQVDYFLQQILYFSCYSRKFRIYRTVFNRNQILVLHNKELRKTPQETMEKTFQFIGLQPFTSLEFNNFKYSSGKNSMVLEPALKKKLSDYLYRDFEVFCKESGISFDDATENIT